MTTALRFRVSPQASRQVRRSRLSNRRQRLSSVQRANAHKVPSAFAPSSILAQSCYVLVRSARRKPLSERPRYQRSCSLRCLWREC